ncbi:hypothetical protein Hamer_G030615, partial [Homarus americanus]
TEHSLINTAQHGFIERKFCLTNLITFLETLTVTDYVTKAHHYRLRDQGSPVDVLYINFSKTFDKDPHARLASKILAYGITGKIL